ncbi:MAG TPA: hypothetical protein VGB18_00350, partial [Candidatus Thermoplasmatota archaeon]
GSTAPDVKAQCWLGMDLAFPDKTNRISMRWAQYTYGGEFFSDVNVSQMPQPGIPLQHDFIRGFNAPGYMTWSVGRQLLLRYGETLTAPETSCIEEYFPGGIDPSQTVAGTIKIFGSSPVSNRNPILSSEATLNLTSLTPTDAVDDDGLPKGTRSAAIGDDAASENGTPTIGGVLILAVLALSAFLRRRN